MNRKKSKNNKIQLWDHQLTRLLKNQPDHHTVLPGQSLYSVLGYKTGQLCLLKWKTRTKPQLYRNMCRDTQKSSQCAFPSTALPALTNCVAISKSKPNVPHEKGRGLHVPRGLSVGMTLSDLMQQGTRLLLGQMMNL